jgi:hypothetical protein
MQAKEKALLLSPFLAEGAAARGATWFMGVMIGVMFYQGSIWKPPFPVAGGFEAATRLIADMRPSSFTAGSPRTSFSSYSPCSVPSST